MPIACRQADPSDTRAAPWFSKARYPTLRPVLTIQELTPKRGSFPLKEKSNWKRITLPTHFRNVIQNIGG